MARVPSDPLPRARDQGLIALPRVSPQRIAIIAVVALQALAIAVLWPPIADRNDYVMLVSAGKAILAGLDLYDPASWSQRPLVIEQLPPSPIFRYPPWAAVAFIPFAPLPLAMGSLLWAVGGLGLAAFATVRVARRWSWPVIPCVALAVASWPALLVFLQGQWGYLLYALAAACLLAIDARRDVTAGVAWGGALLVKPHLFVIASLALGGFAIASRRPRIVLAALATTLAGLAVGTLAQPRWLEPFVRELMGPVTLRSTQQPTLAGLAGDVAGDHWLVAWSIAVLLLAAVAVATVRATPAGDRLPMAFASILALSASSALYSWSYDQYLVVMLGAATLGIAPPRRAPRATVYLAVALLFGPVAFALFESAYVRWHDTGAGLVPVLALLAAWSAAWWRHRAMPA